MFRVFKQDFNELILTTDNLIDIRLLNLDGLKKPMTVRDITVVSKLNMKVVRSIEKLNYRDFTIEELLLYMKGCGLTRMRFTTVKGKNRYKVKISSIPKLRSMFRVPNMDIVKALGEGSRVLIGLEEELVKLESELELDVEGSIVIDGNNVSGYKLGKLFMLLKVLTCPIEVELTFG